MAHSNIIERANLHARIRRAWMEGVRREMALLRFGKGILKVGGVGTGTVQRVRQEMGGPFADAAA
jgi:hypothetical protein